MNINKHNFLLTLAKLRTLLDGIFNSYNFKNVLSEFEPM